MYRDTQQKLAAALERHQSGDLDRAGSLYREVLAREPRNADALHLSGVLHFQNGDRKSALELVASAVKHAPHEPKYRLSLAMMLADAGRLDEALRTLAKLGDTDEAHFQRGNVLMRLRRFEEAVAAYTASLHRQPQSADAYNNLANAFLHLGRLQEAENACRRAIELSPPHSDAHLTLGNILVRQGDRSLARIEFERSIRLNPRSARAWCNLGNLLREENLASEAEDALRRALALNRNLPEALLNLGALLEAGERLDEAERCYREALNGDSPEARIWTNLGNIHKRRGEFDQALACADRAVALEPQLAAAHNNRGAVLERLGRRDEARAEYEGAIRLEPDFAEAHFNRGLWLLQSGRFEEGWREHEWRLRDPGSREPNYPWPVWDGSPLEGRTILLYTEQGLGDAIQFIRYASLVKQLGATVLLYCHQRLESLLRGARGVDGIVTTDSALPAIDCRAPLMSLPRIFGTDLTNLPADVPYLTVSGATRRQWHARLSSFTQRRVGLVWAGNKSQKANPHRSTSLRRFETLVETPGVQFFSLQRGPDAAELLAPRFAEKIVNLEEDENGTIDDTAAAILELDLVITVDTMTAHLAGALAKPVWILLEHACDWRWLLDRCDSPWYPTARLFRQPHRGDWSSVIEQVRKELTCRRQP